MSYLESVQIAFQFLWYGWWLWLLPIFVVAAFGLYKMYLQEKYAASLMWVTLQIRIPEAIQKSPKAAELMFAGFHGIWAPLSWKDYWLKGKFNQDHISLEIIGENGIVSFWVRTPDKYRNLIEAHVYAQYPDAEIIEQKNPLDTLSTQLPNEEYDVWGGELILTKEDAYPIRTHPEFEESSGIGEDKRLDPLAAISEVLGSLRSGERVVLQYLVRPTADDKWIKEGQAIVDKMLDRVKPPEATGINKFFDSVEKLFGVGVPAKKEEKKPKSVNDLSYGEQEIIKAIQRNIAKLGFDTGIRFFYIARRDVFNMSIIGAVIGAFKQFTMSNLNGFKLNTKAFTSDRGIFGNYMPNKGLFASSIFLRRKQEHYRKLRGREWVSKSFVFNTEELATVFHLPTIGVRAPAVPKIEAKKGMPPATLPIE